MIVFPVLCAAACAALLVAERHGSRPGIWVAKTTASSAFVAAAVANGALATAYGRTVLVALCLSWVGDVLLIPDGRPRVFLVGIGSFFAAHVAFGGAFLALGVSPPALAGSGLLLVPAGVAIFRWLRPHLDGVFRVAVPAYIAAIGVMVALSVSAAAAGASWAVAAGAFMFAVSDVSVAKNRFIEERFGTILWGLPLYFAAQIVLASTVA